MKIYLDVSKYIFTRDIVGVTRDIVCSTGDIIRSTSNQKRERREVDSRREEKHKPPAVTHVSGDTAGGLDCKARLAVFVGLL